MGFYIITQVMQLSHQLAKHFRDIISDGDFAIGTSYKIQLENVDCEMATAKTGPHNSIAALVFHINYYVAGILKVFKGGSLDIRDQYSFDMPEICSDGDWEVLKTKFFKDAAEFADLVAEMPDEKLETPFVDGKYGDHFKNITAMIQHCYYHLGQIVLIKKLLTKA